MNTYENPPPNDFLSNNPPPKEQLGIADTAVDRELSNLEDEEALPSITIAATNDPLRTLFHPSNPSSANPSPSPLLPHLPSPSILPYEKGVADVSVDSPSYPNAPPPTPQIDPGRVPTGTDSASRKNAEIAVLNAAIKATSDARKAADKIKLIDYTLTAILMRMQNDRMLSGLLPKLSRDVAEKALTRFYKSRSEEYRGTLAGQSSVEDALALEVRQLHDAVNMDRINGAVSNPGCGVDLVQRMEDVEIDSSRERKRELAVVERELKDFDREMAESADQMTESPLKHLAHTKERYNHLHKLHIETEQHREQQVREQQMREQLLREQQVREQQVREQQLKGQRLRERQLMEQQVRDYRAREREHMEQNFKALNIDEQQRRGFQRRELERRMSTGDRMLPILDGGQKVSEPMYDPPRVAVDRTGTRTVPVPQQPTVSSNMYAAPASEYGRMAPPSTHPGGVGGHVMRPDPRTGNAMPLGGSAGVARYTQGQKVSNATLMQQHHLGVPVDQRVLHMAHGGTGSNSIPYIDLRKAYQLPQGPRRSTPAIVHPVQQDYPSQIGYNLRAHVRDNDVMGPGQQNCATHQGNAPLARVGDPPRHRPPPEYGSGRPHSLSCTPIMQMPYDDFNPLPQHPQAAGFGTTRDERLGYEQRRDIPPYSAYGHQSQQLPSDSGYPVGTYYEEEDATDAHAGHSDQPSLPVVSSQPSPQVADPCFDPGNNPIMRPVSAHTQRPPGPYDDGNAGAVGVVDVAGNSNVVPASERLPIPSYPLNRESPALHAERENYYVVEPENEAAEVRRVCLPQSDSLSLATAQSQPLISRPVMLAGQPPGGFPPGEESLAIYRQVEKGPDKYVEGTVRVQGGSNPQIHAEMMRQDSRSYQEYMHIIKGRARVTDDHQSMHQGLVGGAQQMASGFEAQPPNMIRRVRSDITSGTVPVETMPLVPRISELSPMPGMAQMQRASRANDPPLYRRHSPVEGMPAPNLEMPRSSPPGSGQADASVRGGECPRSNQDALQSMVNAFANI